MILDGTGFVSNPNGNHPMGTIVRIALHHEGPPANRRTVISPAMEEQVIRNIDAYHAAAPRSWGGFAYHGAVFASGRAYKTGAYTGTRAHIHRRNSSHLGIVYLDDLSAHGATKEGLEGIAALILDIYQELGVNLPVDIHTNLALTGSGTSCPMQLAGQVNGILSIVGGDDMGVAEDLELIKAHLARGSIAARLRSLGERWQADEAWTENDETWLKALIEINKNRR